jgi:hypothetical protein
LYFTTHVTMIGQLNRIIQIENDMPEQLNRINR